jgi:hypothetical protein
MTRHTPVPPCPACDAGCAGAPGSAGRGRAARTLLALPAAAAAGSLGLLAAGCASPAARPAPAGAEPVQPPAPRVGDRWRYLLVNLYNRGPIGETTVTVAATSPELRLRIDAGDGSPALEERWADPWTVLRDTGYDRPVSFEAPVPVVPAGARTGQSLRSATRYRGDDGDSRYAWNQQLRVIGWERVQVPAGAFDALRIERMIGFQHPDPFRYDPWRTDTVWYAPQVGRWVLREWTGHYMPGGPSPLAGRAREDWVQWQLVAWEPAGR